MKTLQSCLNKYNIDPKANLTKEEEYSLRLIITDFNDNIPNFMIEMQDYKFDKLKKIAIDNIEDLSQPHVKELNRFFKYGFPNELKVFYLQSDMTNIIDLKSGLEILLRSVYHQVYLFGFKFDQNTLRGVFEGSRNAKELVMYGCQMDDIDPTFTIDPSITYGLEVLDLYETCKKKEKEYLDKVKLKRLVKALAKTNIKQTLKKVHVRSTFYKEKSIQKMFSKQGFIIKVKANEKPPKMKE